jgi:hypothetical protein
MNKKRAPIVFVLIALVFLGIAYVLSRGSADARGPDAGPKVAEKERKQVVFPRNRHARKESGALADAQVSPEKKKEVLDQMQRALLPPGGKGAVFVEVNAIRHTPLMEKVLKCRESEMLDGLNAMKNELGIDPMEDLDRVGMMQDVVAASGFFQDFKVPKELGEGSKYGDTGTIWKTKNDDGEDMYFAKVADGMLMTSSNESSLHAAIDRAEGKGPVGEPLDPQLSKAEMYGAVDGALAAQLLGSSGNPQAVALAGAIAQANMRMNMDENVAASFDISGKTPQQGEDLRKALTAALAVARAQAQAQGEDELASLLEQARVDPQSDGNFGLDVAVPGELVLKSMGCDQDGNKPAAPPAPPAPPADAPPAPPITP